MTAAPLPLTAREPSAVRVGWGSTAVVVLGLSAAARAGLLAFPFWNDSGLYVALGRTVAHGGVLYRDLYETKLPGVGMLASVAYRAFGPWWPGYVLAQFTMTIVAAAVIARAVGRHVGPAAAWPCFLYAAAYLNFDYAVFTGFQLETIQAFFECMAAASALEALGAGGAASAGTAGLAAGVAAMAKPGGAGVAVVLIVLLLVRKRWRAAGAAVGGVVVPVACVVWFSVATGAWEYLPGVVRDIGRYAAGTPVRWADGVSLVALTVGMGLPFVVLGRGTGPWKCFNHNPGETDQNLPVADSVRPGVRGFVLLWLTVDVLSAVAQRRMYLYYFLPLAGPVAAWFGAAARSARPAVVLSGLLPVGILSLTWGGCKFARPPFDQVAEYVSSHTRPDEAAYADPVGRLAVECDRDPGAAAGVLFYWANDDDAPADYCSRLIADLDSRRTAVVVLSGSWDVPFPPMCDGDLLSRCPERRRRVIDQWARFRAYLRGRYEVETVVDGNVIYRRRVKAAG